MLTSTNNCDKQLLIIKKNPNFDSFILTAFHGDWGLQKGGMAWEFGISRCKLLYKEWTNDTVLLYSTVNSIQYPVTSHNGKEKKTVT